ncbi:MAG: DUF1559 domain-containing protein [Planctomycetaceae bacterium]|nr:DUF1559 domain-containing protein [Planctomycetaceae bacterium]
MPVVVSCRCGQRFQAPDHLAGKTVPCPACGQPLSIGSASAAAAPAAAQKPRPPAAANKPATGIAVTCACGRTLRAPESLRGRSAKCPSCGGLVQVPPAPSAEIDIFGIDPLMSSDPLAGPAGFPAADPLAAPAGGPLHRPAAAQAATSAGGTNKWLLIGVGGGGAALALIVVVAVLVSMGGNSNVAEAPSANTPTNQPSAAAPATGATTSTPAAISSTPAIAASSSPAPSIKPAVATQPSPPAATSATGAVATSAASAANSAVARPKASSGRHVLSDLPAGVQAWHEDKRGNLVGIFNLKEDQNPNAQLSWMTALLPHLGYQKHYDSLIRDKPITERANLQVGVVTIPEFLNPIEGKSRWSGYPFDGLALTHFAGMSGVEDARNTCAGQLPRSDPRAGVFGYDAVARPAQITDGTSQTVMIVGSGPLASPWIMGGGSTIRGVREPLFDPISGLGTRGLSSGGTLVVMADGSVRQIPANVDPKVFRAMCTIHGAETVDLGQTPAFNIEEWK